MRALCVSLLMAAASAAAMPALASEATTTRIETRPFYGATVTIEAGVRVFRPLPPHGKVIINPNGKTPVHLGFEENTWTSHNYNHNYDYGRAAPVDGAYPAAGFVGDGFRGHRRPHHHHGQGQGARR